MKRELLRMEHVSLIRNGEALLDNLNLQIFAGEIMGLLTGRDKGHDQLISLLCQNHPISFGSVWYDGKTINRYSYSDGSFNRVCVIEQTSHLVKGLTIVDNLFVLRKGFKKYWINERILQNQAEAFFQENGIPISIRKRVSDLTPLERCLVELGKGLLLGCRLIVVDNPGNFLSQHELIHFQDMLKRIQKQGVSVLYVGNHHQELFRIADRTSLLYDGQIIKVFERDEMTDEQMAPYITDWFVPGKETVWDAGEGILHFHDVFTKQLHGLEFVLHKGECLTILDMDNQISGDVLSLLTGKEDCRQGRITLEHKPYTRAQAADYLKAGIAVIPKDCTESLLFHERTYMENLTFLLDRKLKRSIIPERIYKSIRNEYVSLVGNVINETNIKSLSLSQQIGLVYHRILLFHPRVLVCIQPLAKGDMFVRMQILSLLRELLKGGTAVLIITANISDTLDISDRLMVVENGRCTVSYEKSEFEFEWYKNAKYIKSKDCLP
ncbi:MAG: sugar ABC transporter ATP-binding protein [Lachnospiraceae bacterium]|jgi:ribose transport system ATP-binding protein|nr:sugar ABC transporter ATP-binding protein [Lachnospiraceae bacterium]